MDPSEIFRIILVFWVVNSRIDPSNLLRKGLSSCVTVSPLIDRSYCFPSGIILPFSVGYH